MQVLCYGRCLFYLQAPIEVEVRNTIIIHELRPHIVLSARQHALGGLFPGN